MASSVKPNPIAPKVIKDKEHGFFYELVKNKALFIMLIPSILFFLVLQYIPMAGIVLAFKKYRYNLGIFGSPWCGFKNFDFFFRSGTAWTVTKNTVVYNFAFILTGILLQITIAIVIYELSSRFVKKYIQAALFVPYFISWVVVGTFIFNLFNYEVGIMNNVLEFFKMNPKDVYGDTGSWPGIIIFFNNWKYLGYNSLIYLAALMGMDKSLLEAARIDGASAWQRIKYITLPLLVPTIIIMFLLSIGHIFRGNFDLFYNVVGNNSLLYKTTDVIDTFVFRSLINSADMGMTAAAGVYQSVLCFAIIMIVNGIIKKINPDYSLF